MQITQNNFTEFAGEELATAFAENKATIISGSFEIFKQIFDAIHTAIETGGHFRKDVRTFMNLQRQWNDAAERELAELKSKQ